MCDKEDLEGMDYKSFPNARHQQARGRWVSGCPLQGGDDRIHAYPDGDKYGKSGELRTRPSLNCNSCGLFMWLGKALGTPVPYVETPETPLDPQIPQMFPLTKGSMAYYAQRGISESVAIHQGLGWTAEVKDPKWASQRYSIPNWEGDTLWGIQLRSSYSGATKRYISWPGSVNRKLFVPRGMQGMTFPWVLSVEAPLDALALWSLGYPAVAPFQGNNMSKAWNAKWNALIKCFGTMIIIPDNARGGGQELTADLIAINKHEAVRQSIAHRLPDQYKDVGELIKADLPTARSRLAKWLGLAPLETK